MDNSKKQSAEACDNNSKSNRTEFANEMNTTNTTSTTHKNQKKK